MDSAAAVAPLARCMTTAPSTSPNAAERVLTPPLVVFLLAVAGVLGFALWQRLPPSPEQAVVQLHDGDLDGDERARAFAQVVAGALGSDEPGLRWAGLLAAIAIGDRPAHAALRSALLDPQGRWQLPPEPAREALALGDPMLGNLRDALLAEANGDVALAAERWRQVAAQSRLVANRFAAELATEAQVRLR